jgi:hypothetical protein
MSADLIEYRKTLWKTKMNSHGPMLTANHALCLDREHGRITKHGSPLIHCEKTALFDSHAIV